MDKDKLLKEASDLLEQVFGEPSIATLRSFRQKISEWQTEYVKTDILSIVMNHDASPSLLDDYTDFDEDGNPIYGMTVYSEESETEEE
jgi:hypothetical protein